ncbi:MAG TPA: alpha-amylase family protein [Methylomirabilota bacterium]|nr:alpha-amylase family protein [Methylomirabilota bacterium]
MINDLWYKNTVIYSLSVETFMDSDGDGVGDFKGLTRRLDYLHGLGVGAIWLSPFQPSPGRDDGYDVAEYYGIDPRLGTLGDFVEFAHGARQRGIRVIMDMVINHTSDQHPWFKEARRDPQSPYRDWYVWSEEKPENADEGMVFPGVQETTWTHDEAASAYYFHRFYHFQPDLNMGNPHVRAEILRIMGFWIQLGVSGFRLDAVPFAIADSGGKLEEDQPGFAYLRRIRAFVQWRLGESVLLAEANVPPSAAIDYFGHDAERLQMMFNFPLNQAIFHALATHTAAPIGEALEATRQDQDAVQWGLHLRNHDELDLGRLEEEQRQKVFDAFAPDPSMQLYDRGIRRRLAPMFDGDKRRLELAYSLLFTLPGTPVIRYGDEIGMGDDLTLPERDSVRTPMQWSDEPQGGFTKSEKPVEPVISDDRYGYRKVNVAHQRRDPESLLNWVERCIRMRKEIPEIGWGRDQVVDVGHPSVFALRYDWRGNSVLFIHNLCEDPCPIRFRVDGSDGRPADLIDVLDHGHSSPDEDGCHAVTMEPYGYRWYRIGGLDYLLVRED